MTAVLGIDLGQAGAVALLTASGDLVWIEDMPCLFDGPAGRRTINAPLLAEIVFKSHATRAFVEHVSARPGEGAVGAFSFGRARGVVEGVLAAAAIPVVFLTPPTWKRRVGIPPGRAGRTSRAARPLRAGLARRRCSPSQGRRSRRSRSDRGRWPHQRNSPVGLAEAGWGCLPRAGQ